MGTPHPLYLGLVNSSPLPAAALADLLVSALNNNGGAFHQSPAMTACEAEVVRAFARLYDLPDGAEGMFLPGGTWATLQALVLARGRAIGRRAPGPGLRIYTSDAAHFSVARSAFVAGIGAEDIVSLPTVGRGELDVELLAETIRRDRRDGKTPLAVVATAGTTGTGAVDPIAEVAELCTAENVWLHIDACYGGAIALLPELRGSAGRRRACPVDRRGPAQVVLHPRHRRPAAGPRSRAWPRAASTPRRAPTSRVTARSMPGGAGFRPPADPPGFTVWMAIRAHGWRTIRDAVRRNIGLTRLLERLLAERGFTVLPDGKLSIACARFEPPQADPSSCDRLQDELARRVVATGQAWFSTVATAGAPG